MNRTTSVLVADLRPGDVVLIDGTPRTVCKRALRRCPFMGATLWGDPHGLTGRKVQALLFPIWQHGERIGWRRGFEGAQT